MPSADRHAVRAYLRRASAAIYRHERYLTRLDAILGDGDHGDNLALGFRAVEELLDAIDPEAGVGELLRSTGSCLVASAGGASGALYGTAFIQAGLEAGEADEIDADLLARMLRAAAAGLARRGRCEVGDKTIYDALEPAVTAFEASRRSGTSREAGLATAIRAAHRGMQETRPLVARRGLALRLGERSIGTIDPGAVSCFLLLRALVPGGSLRPRPGRDRPVGASA